MDRRRFCLMAGGVISPAWKGESVTYHKKHSNGAFGTFENMIPRGNDRYCPFHAINYVQFRGVNYKLCNGDALIVFDLASLI
jgi:hypothetical protein